MINEVMREKGKKPGQQTLVTPHENSFPSQFWGRMSATRRTATPVGGARSSFTSPVEARVQKGEHRGLFIVAGSATEQKT